VPLAVLREAGGFDERFREYGWEDLDLGLRLRHMGVPSILAKDALVYHYKPPAQPAAFSGMARQARAQARTAVQFMEKHPHWRVALATGQVAPRMWLSAVARGIGWPNLLATIAGDDTHAQRLPMGVRRWAAGRLANAEYFGELARVRAGAAARR
jgi:GT2 family glycosyltransferase